MSWQWGGEFQWRTSSLATDCVLAGWRSCWPTCYYDSCDDKNSPLPPPANRQERQNRKDSPLTRYIFWLLVRVVFQSCGMTDLGICPNVLSTRQRLVDGGFTLRWATVAHHGKDSIGFTTLSAVCVCILIPVQIAIPKRMQVLSLALTAWSFSPPKRIRPLRHERHRNSN